MGGPALKLIHRSSPFVEKGKLWSSDNSECHSLHFSISYPESFKPQLAAYFLDRYSKPGNIVLDPFCGRGTVALESVLGGRVSYAFDINPLAAAIARAKLEPVDLADVARYLQSVDFGRPVALDGYRELFSPFYDVDTYREIVNLKNRLLEDNTRASRFVQMLALTLLNGHTSGYFSVYTFPQFCVSPEVQRGINNKRLQNTEYRAVMPRVLRKASAVLRDGGLSAFDRMAALNKTGVLDARNLSRIPTGAVDLTIMGPPRPHSRDLGSDLWLKLWFLGVSRAEIEHLRGCARRAESVSAWLEFMNETMVEQARVVRPGGRLVMDLCDMKQRGKTIRLDQAIAAIVEDDLSSFWEIEGYVYNFQSGSKLENVLRLQNSSNAMGRNKVLVLRRR